MTRDEWLNPEHPPADPALDLGSGVWASWAAPWSKPSDVRPIIWHWCTRSVFIAKHEANDPSEDRRMLEWYDPQWVPAGVNGHDFISREPLHVEPSLLWSDCCGLHGWIRGGKWVSC